MSGRLDGDCPLAGPLFALSRVSRKSLRLTKSMRRALRTVIIRPRFFCRFRRLAVPLPRFYYLDLSLGVHILSRGGGFIFDGEPFAVFMIFLDIFFHFGFFGPLSITSSIPLVGGFGPLIQCSGAFGLWFGGWLWGR